MLKEKLTLRSYRVRLRLVVDIADGDSSLFHVMGWKWQYQKQDIVLLN